MPSTAFARLPTAFVTGASRGIGRAIALELAANGCAVAVGYRERHAEADAVVADIHAAGGKAVALSLAIEERAQVRAAFAAAEAALGPLGILVNNAAMAQEKPFAEIEDADWDRMLAVNLRGPFICCQEALKGMQERGWGRIVNIVSIGGQWGGVNQIHYASAKAGLIGLTRSLAKIYSRHGITTNAVSPGLVRTDMTAGELASAAGQEKVRAIPAGRIADAEEVARTVAFLASDAASYVTGQTLNVNGGMYFG